MKFLRTILIFALLFTIVNCNAGKKVEDEAVKGKKVEKQTKMPIATIETNMGTIKVELWPNITPKTVANFTGLANGTKEWTNPKTKKKEKKPFYDGLIFHRVIKDFMIQGGCPLGTGTGNPGYKFEDECYDEDGKLKATVDYGSIAMANSGPNTNGSQFFIVTKKGGTPWLNGKHTVFGKVIEGMDVVLKIQDVEKGKSDKPVKDVIMTKVRVK